MGKYNVSFNWSVQAEAEEQLPEKGCCSIELKQWVVQFASRFFIKFISFKVKITFKVFHFIQENSSLAKN
ncbi:hypothetical protein GCM10007971_33970 [Oceanobacillus indicireducens]|uniref:Uncharacterized protein n=1 Tax=Oceanobacillus indicireducens TaxID=1004261 RepID=A0A918D419_9BACI|nr:hypothetical protein GCM10007971_33970 [Oceanobacillus indicireducens]